MGKNYINLDGLSEEDIEKLKNVLEECRTRGYIEESRINRLKEKLRRIFG